MTKKFIYSVLTIVFSVLIAVGIILAWTEPGVAPPGSNVLTPLNIGSEGQSKIGGLILNTGNATSGLIVQYGNVGIGTTSPSAKLHIVGVTDQQSVIFDGVATNYLTVKGNGTDRGYFGISSGILDGSLANSFGIRANSALHFGTNGNNIRMTIDTSGNVGIGTTSPSSALTVYGGLTIGNTPQRGSWNQRVPMNNTNITIDSTNDVGQYSAITIGSDGLPVIAYWDSVNRQLKVAKCGNQACSSGNTITAVDYLGYQIGMFPSIAINSNGLPIIAYYNTTGGDLNVLKCGNQACSSGNTTAVVDSTNDVGKSTSIAIGSDGLAVISYLDDTNDDLRVAKCGNQACTSGNTLTTVDSTNDVGRSSSITIGTDGLPVISYYYFTGSDLKVVKCGNQACSSGNTITTVDSANNAGAFSSITIGADGLPVISYYEFINDDLRVAKCGNQACSSGNTLTTVDSTNGPDGYTSITIGADGLPVIAFYDDTNGDLKVVKCGNQACTSGNTITTVDSTNDVGAHNSIAIGADGLPVISNYDYTNFDLKVAKCGSENCIPYWTRR